MYESMLLFRVIIVAWPVIKWGVVAGAVYYIGKKIKRKLDKIKRLKKIEQCTSSDINKTDKNGKTMFMNVQNIKECELLLSKGCNLNAVDKNGNTALMYMHEPEIISWMIEHGADINAINKDGRNALMLNVMRNNEANIKTLLNLGADTSLIDNEGKSVLQHYLETMVQKRPGRLEKNVPEGCMIINADILQNLMASSDMSNREKTKKTLSLQGKKGQLHIETCQKTSRSNEHEQSEVLDMPASNNSRRKKCTNANSKLHMTKEKGA